VIIAASASAAAATLTLPAHQPGDMLMILAPRTTSATPPTIPGATATVPAWQTIYQAGANTLSLTAVYAIATASNHACGTFTGANQIACLVLRPDSGKELSLGATSTGAVNNTQTIVYPALTPQLTDGSSFGVRAGCRRTADSEVANAPTGWTNQVVQPTGAGALLAVHTKNSTFTGNEAVGTVTTAGTNAAYRAYSIEVIEALPAAPATPLYETIVDDFNRANGLLDAGAGAAIWTMGWIDSGEATALRVISNQLGSNVANWQPAFTKTEIDNSSGNCDVLIDCIAVPTTNNEFGLYCLISDVGTPTFACYTVFWSGGSWILRRYANGANAGDLQEVAGTIAAGDTLWFSKRGSALKFYRRPSGGSFTQILSATNAAHNPAKGVIAVEISDVNQRWDNLRGGPIVSAAPAGPKIVTVV
jgi:hypothetical protein